MLNPAKQIKPLNQRSVLNHKPKKNATSLSGDIAKK